MTIICDFSQICISSIFPLQRELAASDKDGSINIIRHAILSSLKFYLKKFKAEYGPLVLACDAHNYWRKSLFPTYKVKRASSREKSGVDWRLIYEHIDQIREEIRHNFPYKLIRVDTAEADDIIATLCEYISEEEKVDMGVFDEARPILIISSDGDFKQLQKHPNVRQWSPIQKKYVEKVNPVSYLNEHIASGDTGDSIPNVLSDDNVFVSGGRQCRMSSARLQEFISLGRDACRDDLERLRWDRNSSLINLSSIPEHLASAIKKAYIDYDQKANLQDVYKYLIKHRCKMLLESVEDF